MLVLLALFWIAPSSGPAAQTLSPGDTRLLVIVTIDQMRFEYLDRYKAFWKAGLSRLTKDGAVFERGFYPYLSTITCAGHATISTGAFPATHGIIANEWFQRAAGRRMSCTDDPTVKSVPYDPGAPEKIGHSAHRLRVPTLGDRLRAASPESRVVSLSMKPRSAVMLGGHGGSAVTWFSDANVWSTSTAFAAGPVPEVQAYVRANPVEADRGKIWNRVYEPSRYAGEDQGLGERPKTGWTPLFAHPLAGAAGTAPAEFFNLWERSPFSDVALGGMAAHLVQAMKLGQRGVVDLLAVSFSALDSVGHDFGPDSHEVQDALIRLDQTLGQLLSVLDKTVGRDRYVVGLSADHGVAQIPEVATRDGKDAGRILNAEVRKVAEGAMAKAYGPGPHVAWVEYADVYLAEAMRKRAVADPQVVRPLIDAVSSMPGVMRAFPAFGLEKKRDSTDPVERAAALTYYPGESGDVIVVLKENWINTADSATTHGTMHPYDQHVPVLFFGKPFKAGRYADPASPADIAPTLASIIKLPMPGVDGKVLKQGLR